MYFKLTSILSLQELGNGVTKAPGAFPESMKSITATDLCLGSIFNLPKSTPSGKVRINPWLNVSTNTGRILIDKPMRRKLDTLDKLLRGKIEHDVELGIDDMVEIDVE